MNDVLKYLIYHIPLYNSVTPAIAIVIEKFNSMQNGVTRSLSMNHQSYNPGMVSREFI